MSGSFKGLDNEAICCAGGMLALQRRPKPTQNLEVPVKTFSISNRSPTTSTKKIFQTNSMYEWLSINYGERRGGVNEAEEELP